MPEHAYDDEPCADEAVGTLTADELAFEASLRELLALPEPSPALDVRVLEAARREADRRRPGGRIVAWLRPFATAAAVLLAAAVVLPATAPRQRTLAPVENPLGISPLRGARVLSAAGAIDGTGRTLTAGAWVDSGDPLVVRPDGHLLLGLAEGTELAFDGGAQATLRFDRHQRRIQLREGRLYADVVKVGTTREQRPIVVETPTGEARVLGTELTAQASAGATRLTVRHGLVRLTNHLGAAYVGASETGLLTGTRRPRSRRTARVDRHFRWIGKLQPGGYHPAEKAFGGGAPGEDEPAIGSLVARGPDGQPVALALAEQRFETLVQHGVAHTTVRFAFRNDADAPLEGTFRFALPKAASISRYAVRQAEGWVEGRVVERERARRIYAEQKRELREPALLEWAAGSAFQAQVFPIEPRAVKELEVSYVEELPERRGVSRLVLPLVSETARLSPPERLRVTCRLLGPEARVAARCPSHHAELGWEDGARVVRLDAVGLRPRNDFVLELGRPSAPAVEAVVEPDPVQGAGAALVRLRADLSWLGDDALPSRVVVLTDASRSQAGTLKEVQLELLEGLLQALPDRVRPRLFAYHVGLDELPSAGPDYDEGLLAALWDAEVGGGSDLGQAFAALGRQLPSDAGVTLVYLGDGVATCGLRDPAALRRVFAQALPPGMVRRLITVGIGPDTDAALLETLARERDGVCVTVRPGDDLGRKVDEAVSALTEPVLTQVAVDLGPDARQVAPAAPANLRDGEALSLSAWVAPGVTRLPVTFSGLVAGRAFELQRVVDLAPAAPGAQLADLWARRRVADLLLAGSAQQDAVLDLALEHAIVTPYTSLVVLSPEEFQRYALTDSRRRATRDEARAQREILLKQAELSGQLYLRLGEAEPANEPGHGPRRGIAEGQVARLTPLTRELEQDLDALRAQVESRKQLGALTEHAEVPLVILEEEVELTEELAKGTKLSSLADGKPQRGYHDLGGEQERFAGQAGGASAGGVYGVPADEARNHRGEPTPEGPPPPPASTPADLGRWEETAAPGASEEQPNLARATRGSESPLDAAALDALRRANTAQSSSREGGQAQDPNLGYGTLKELADATLVEGVLGHGTKQGYRFRGESPVGASDPWFRVANPAVPTTTGDRYFGTNQAGTVFYEQSQSGEPDDTGVAVFASIARREPTVAELRDLVRALDAADAEARGPLFDQLSGVCYALEARPARCAWLVRELLRYAPQDLDLHELLGACYETLGRRREAVRAYSGLVEAQPDDVRARLRYALALERLGLVDQALAACAAAVTLDAGLPEARFALARLAVRAGRLDLAEAQLEALLARSFDAAEHGDVHGQARAGLRAIYERAIQRWPAEAERYRAALLALGD